MLDEIMNTLEEMRQERNEFHDVVIKRFTKKVTTMRQEMRQES
jgi:hypothetical protein